MSNEQDNRTGFDLINSERQRQIATEGWTTGPKNQLRDLIRAGALYLAESEKQIRLRDSAKADYWRKRAEIIGEEIDRLNNNSHVHEQVNRTACPKCRTINWQSCHSMNCPMREQDNRTCELHCSDCKYETWESCQLQRQVSEQDNRTAEEILDGLAKDATYKEYPPTTHNWEDKQREGFHRGYVQAHKDVAQQTAALREEVEQWKESLPHKALIRENRRLKEELESVKAENERLKAFEEHVKSSQNTCALCGCSIDAHRNDFTCPDFTGGEFNGWLETKFLVR